MGKWRFIRFFDPRMIAANLEQVLSVGRQIYFYLTGNFNLDRSLIWKFPGNRSRGFFGKSAVRFHFLAIEYYVGSSSKKIFLYLF